MKTALEILLLFVAFGLILRFFYSILSEAENVYNLSNKTENSKKDADVTTNSDKTN